MQEASCKIKYGFLSENEQIFPAMVIAKITNVCNLKCIHCPHVFVSQGKNYKPRHMEWDVYKKIVDEVSDYKGVIFRLLCDGEPLMHPRFLDMVKLAKAKNLGPFNLITNGLLLDKELAIAILEYGVEAVEISLDAFDRETYNKIRRNSDYDRVMLNVQRFIDLRNKMKTKTRIMVSIIDQPEVETEIEAFIKYWTPKVDRVITRVYTSIGGLVNHAKMKIDSLGDRWPCPLLWRRIFINVDGFAEFCVEDWYDETIIGDTRIKNIKEIWHSPAYEEIRRLHLLRRFDGIPYCKRCIDWKAREWDYDYFNVLNHILCTVNIQ